jgi:hypothetical protein
MKWTPVDSHGLDVVLKPLTMNRVLHALEKLQNSSHGSKQASLPQIDHCTEGARRHTQALQAPLLSAVERISSCSSPFGGSAK